VVATALWSPAAGRDLESVLVRFKPDVVHMHNLFPLLSPAVLASCRRQHVPAVVTFHNYRQICPSGDLFRAGRVCADCVGRLPLPALRHGCYKGSSLATLPLAVGVLAHRAAWQKLPSAYVFISKAQQDLFSVLKLPPERCFVKGNLVPATVRKARTEDLVVYVGRLNEAKGLRLLMKAWDIFSADRGEPGGTAPLRLVIAGSGPLEDEVKAWAAGRSGVDAVGLLSREACADLVARARAVVVPSEWLETFGLVVVEAMAAGVAVIAPAHASFPELVTDTVDGALYPPGDAAALAAVLGQVQCQPGYFEALGTSGRATYETRFRPDVNLAKLEEIYRFAVDNPAWRGPVATPGSQRAGVEPC